MTARRGRRRGRRALSGLLALGLAYVAFAACGSRSGLLVGGQSELPPTSAFCATGEYASGGKDLAIYVLLDKSGSMGNDNKWTKASAAVDAFVHDPNMNGVAVALQYFPLGGSCDFAPYSAPAVAVGELPDHAQAISDSLAVQTLSGETPTLPALRGAIEYSRALALAEPSRTAVVALVTDDEPNACDSTADSVAAAAGDGATGSPQVLTFAIGFQTGFLAGLDLIAAKGGTGKSVVVNEGPNAGQDLVTALRTLRDTELSCRFAVPPVAGAKPKASDVQVGYRVGGASPITGVVRLADSTACAASPNGFYLDDPEAPTEVELCPGLCSVLHANAGSRVTVVDGCAGSFDAGTPVPTLDGGPCSGAVSFYCTPACGSTEHASPVCVGGLWECPPGSVSSLTCTSCSAVPHMCCQGDGTLAEAACIDGDWKCAPGAKLYGEPGCTAPDVCASSLPCAIGQYCASPSFACGTGTLAGHCVPKPAACSAGGPPVCGCDGQTYPDACHARQTGIDISATQSCPAPSGDFACGPYFCKIASEVCKKVTLFGGPVPVDDYACITPPPGCPSGCGCNACQPCPAGKVCTETCSTDPSGGRKLSCSEL